MPSKVISIRRAPVVNMTVKFFITTAKCDFLDGKHVVFGKVIDGMLTLRKIENVPTGANNRPKLAVKITGMYALLGCLPWVLTAEYRMR